MTSFSNVQKKEQRLRAEVFSAHSKISQAMRVQVQNHLKNIHLLLSERISILSDIADNASEWKAKKGVTVPRLQRERREIVAMIDGWSKFGF